MRLRWYTKGELIGLLRDLILRIAPGVRLQDDSILWTALKQAIYETALRTLPLMPEYWVNVETQEVSRVYRRVELGNAQEALVYRLPPTVIRVREVWVRQNGRSVAAVYVTPGEFQVYLRSSWTSPLQGGKIVWFHWGSPEVAETDARYRALWVLPLPAGEQPTVIVRYTAFEAARQFSEDNATQYPLPGELEAITLNIAVERALYLLGIPEVDAELVWRDVARTVNTAIVGIANERLGILRESETTGEVETLPVAQQQ